MFTLASSNHTASDASKALRSQGSKGTLGRFTKMLGCLALALTASACDDVMVQDEDCPANPGVTLSAADLTPGGLSARELRAGLANGPYAKTVLQRVHTMEDTKAPERLDPREDGVAFDLSGAPASLEASVELVPREEGLHFKSVGTSCSGEACPAEFRCVEHASMLVDLHIRSTDGSFEAVIPVDLEYSWPEDRGRFPWSGDLAERAKQGQYAFFGRGSVDASENQGSLRIVNPVSRQGAPIDSTGFGVEVLIVDQKIVSLDLMSRFEFDPKSAQTEFLSLSQRIYSTGL